MQNGQLNHVAGSESTVEVLSCCYLNSACDVIESSVDQIDHQFHPDRARIDRNAASPETNGKINGDAIGGEKNCGEFFDEHDIVLQITDFIWTRERFMDSLTYKIEVHHAGYQWTILRNYQQIHALHINLYFFDESRRLHDRIRGQTPDTVISAPDTKLALPMRCSVDATVEQKAEHSYEMESYFWKLFLDLDRRKQAVTHRFLAVSPMSFPLGPVLDWEKDPEAIIQKLSCHLHEYCFIPCNHDNVACRMFSQWKERWIVIQETCYIYMHTGKGLVAGVFLLDQHMEIELLSTRKTALIVKHALKDVILRFPNKLEMELWRSQMAAIRLKSPGHDFSITQPHGSFCPVRDNVAAKFFVNGAPYMEAVADALESAKEEIFIGGWWVSPDVFLKRPITDGTRWRLDQILKRKAEEGVQVYILMYKESRIALGINSFYTKKKLTRLHPNIHVQRHPDKNVLLWSHHEKMVVVDQQVAFVGGIDLCYGRWDDHRYKLCDVTKEMLEHGVGDTGAALDKYGQPEDLNVRHVDKPTPKPAVRKGKKRDAARNAAMAPWRGVRARMSVPKFRARSYLNYRARKYKRTFVGRVQTTFRKIFGEKTKEEKEECRETRLEELEHLAKECVWLGKDYCNEVKYAFSQPDTGDPYEDLLDRKDTPRLPWHDAAACLWGVAARDTARHFIQKWNACKFQKFRFEEDHPFLIPKLYETCVLPDVFPENASSCRVQILRSTCSWSSGLLPDVVEHSIQQGYIQLIRDSKHFVYMESQFFITLVGSKKTVKNGVGDALFERIVRASKQNENFRLYIVLPLQPAIAGAYGTRAGAAVQAVTHWIYQSLSRGKYSLLGNLSAIGVDPSNYVTVCGLRQHGEIVGRLATELIYVHSKLMVVDDVSTIIGSANMNDRSMTGDRDSEIAWLVQDTQFEDSMMDGRPYRSGLFSGRLRKHLMKINLGLLEDMPYGLSPEESALVVQDPICEKFYRDVYIEAAVRNEVIFQEVFACVPNDKVFTFSELKDFEKQKTMNETDPDKARERLAGVRGYLVKFPLKFLKDSKLLPAYSTAAGLLPAINWT